MSNVRQAHAPEAQKTHGKLDRRLAGWLWTFLRPYKKWVILSLSISLCSGLLATCQPIVAQRILHKAIETRDMQYVVRWSLLFFGLVIAGATAQMTFSYLSAWVGQQSMHDMRVKLYRHILGLDVPFFDRNPVGRLITRLTSDVQVLNDLFAAGLVQILGDLIVMFGVLGIMFSVSWRLTLVVLACAPAMLFVARFFRNHSRYWFQQTRRAIATLNSYLQENVAGVRTVQTFNREAPNHAAFSALNDDYRYANIRTIFVFAIFFPAVALVNSMTVAAVIWFGGRMMIAGRMDGGAPPFAFDTLFMFVYCVHMMFHPVRALTEKYNMLQAGMASSERLLELFGRESKISAPLKPAPIPVRPKRIAFEDVHFGYKDGEPVLKGVDFEILEGQTVAVVGATGAGKSTLLNLLTRFYDVGAGRVTIDGRDVKQYDPLELRRLYAVVLQEVFLFNGSVAENLRLANPDLPGEALWNILEEVSAAGFVRGLEKGLDAPVGERGSAFSTGQKQLLSMARALAADPAVLILDEATASVDTHTEHLIQQAIERLLAGRTSLVIAHRLSTIRRADKIVVMHHGQVHESGTHEELLAMDGLYRRLYEMQYREEAVVTHDGKGES